jgi:hypothetical protein
MRHLAYAALAAVAFMLAGPAPASAVQQADASFGDELVIAEATDKDFNDAVDAKGDPLYEWAELPTLVAAAAKARPSILAKYGK